MAATAAAGCRHETRRRAAGSAPARQHQRRLARRIGPSSTRRRFFSPAICKMAAPGGLRPLTRAGRRPASSRHRHGPRQAGTATWRAAASIRTAAASADIASPYAAGPANGRLLPGQKSCPSSASAYGRIAVYRPSARAYLPSRPSRRTAEVPSSRSIVLVMGGARMPSGKQRHGIYTSRDAPLCRAFNHHLRPISSAKSTRAIWRHERTGLRAVARYAKPADSYALTKAGWPRRRRPKPHRAVYQPKPRLIENRSCHHHA